MEIRRNFTAPAFVRRQKQLSDEYGIRDESMRTPSGSHQNEERPGQFHRGLGVRRGPSRRRDWIRRCRVTPFAHFGRRQTPAEDFRRARALWADGLPEIHIRCCRWDDRPAVQKFLFRKNVFQYGAYILIKTVVIIHIEKSAIFQITAKVFHLGIVHGDVSVAGHKQKGIIENIAAAKLHIIVPRTYTNRHLLFQIVEHIGEGCRGAVPVAPAAILNPRDFKLLIILCLKHRNQYKRETKKDNGKNIFHHYSKCVKR